MMASPRPGTLVRLTYRKALHGVAPWQGKTGTVVVSGRGKPRNHPVEVEGRLVVVPCGHLTPIP